MTRRLVLLTTLAAMLGTVSCGVLSTLQLVVDATAAAIPVLQASGVPIPPVVLTYVGDVASCVANQPDPPTAAEILTISACLASKVAPTLPPGTPQAIVNVISDIVNAVAKFLAQNPPNQKPASVKFDVTKAQELKQKARMTVAAIDKMKGAKK